MVVLPKNRSAGALRQASARTEGEIHLFARRTRGGLQRFIGDLVSGEVCFTRGCGEGRYHLLLLCVLLFAKRVGLHFDWKLVPKCNYGDARSIRRRFVPRLNSFAAIKRRFV
jgi:hypothetical protein